jgi:hypothetical protein
LVTAGIAARRITAAFHIESVLNKGKAETRSTAVLCGVGGVQKISQQETDELERHGNHGVPHKGEH